jgi:hypothetical protein
MARPALVVLGAKERAAKVAQGLAEAGLGSVAPEARVLAARVVRKLVAVAQDLAAPEARGWVARVARKLVAVRKVAQSLVLVAEWWGVGERALLVVRELAAWVVPRADLAEWQAVSAASRAMAAAPVRHQTTEALPAALANLGARREAETDGSAPCFASGCWRGVGANAATVFDQGARTRSSGFSHQQRDCGGLE